MDSLEKWANSLPAEAHAKHCIIDKTEGAQIKSDTEGNLSVDKCKQACVKKFNCKAFEWHEGGYCKPSLCYPIDYSCSNTKSCNRENGIEGATCSDTNSLCFDYYTCGKPFTSILKAANPNRGILNSKCGTSADWKNAHRCFDPLKDGRGTCKKDSAGPCQLVLDDTEDSKVSVIGPPKGIAGAKCYAKPEFDLK